MCVCVCVWMICLIGTVSRLGCLGSCGAAVSKFGGRCAPTSIGVACPGPHVARLPADSPLGGHSKGAVHHAGTSAEEDESSNAGWETRQYVFGVFISSPSSPFPHLVCDLSRDVCVQFPCPLPRWEGTQILRILCAWLEFALPQLEQAQQRKFMSWVRSLSLSI